MIFYLLLNIIATDLCKEKHIDFKLKVPDKFVRFDHNLSARIVNTARELLKKSMPNAILVTKKVNKNIYYSLINNKDNNDNVFLIHDKNLLIYGYQITDDSIGKTEFHCSDDWMTGKIDLINPK